jgi:Family of unknown function (DUF6884)
MSHFVLIACVAKKAPVPTAACRLYQSPLFRKEWRYAESLHPDGIFILSAKHGLVDANQVIAPYDETLNTKTVAEARKWAENVVSQLKAVADCQRDRFTILAGIKYRRFLVPYLRDVEIPLKGLSIGRQLQALDRLSERS